MFYVFTVVVVVVAVVVVVQIFFLFFTFFWFSVVKYKHKIFTIVYLKLNTKFSQKSQQNKEATYVYVPQASLTLQF